MRLLGWPFGRRRRPRRWPLARLGLAALILLVLDSLYLVSQLPSPTISNPSQTTSSSTEADPAHRDPTAATRNRTIFIASVHRDSAPRLHASWTANIARLVEQLGRENIFISIVEAGSADGTRAELTQLRERLSRLGVEYNIALGPTAWELQDEATRQPTHGERWPGWIFMPEVSEWALRRVPIVARVRNQALFPLTELAAREGRRFDSVLWIDDNIVFDTRAVTDLLATRGGTYSAACAMNLGPNLRIRDDGALRDDQGRPPTSWTWPWFSSPASRAAAQAGEPVPVSSCWNGMVAFDPAPFYADEPLQFRAISDDLAGGHLEATERCLIHHDNHMSASLGGVWVNPSVQVTRSTSNGEPPGWFEGVVGGWANRLESWLGRGPAASIERAVQTRLQHLAADGLNLDQAKQNEPGMSCLIDSREIIPRKRQTKWIITPRD